MYKKGELTSMQIVVWVIAIAGLVIGLIFFVSIKNGNYSVDQVCKVSVLGRATAQKAVSGSSSFVPLQCTTKKICITTSKSGSCAQFKGENDVEKVILPKGEIEARHLIEKTSAEAMYRCWEMMGEGKLDLFNSISGGIGLNPSEPTCVICSRIAIDKSVNPDWFNKTNINNYLQNNYVPGTSTTYLQAFTDKGVKSFVKVSPDASNSLDGALKSVGPKDPELVGINDVYGGVQSNVNREMAYVFMQIKPNKVEDVLERQLQYGATAAGVGAFVTPNIPGGRATIWVLNQALGIVPKPIKIVAALGGVAAVAGYGAYNSIQGQHVAAGYCGEFTTKESANEGCSLLEAVNYNVNDINALCKSIQGNP